MYVKDSIIEAQIIKDLEKQHLKGRIEEIERHIRLDDNKTQLENRLKVLRGELKLLSD